MSWSHEAYRWWCVKLPRCKKAGKVSWPTRELAEMALPVMVERAIRDGLDVPEPGVYQCRIPYGCRLYHLTRNRDSANRQTAMQRQRENQPDTYREKVRRQRAARKARDKAAKQAGRSS